MSATATSGAAEDEEKGLTDALRLGVHKGTDNRTKVSVIPPALPPNQCTRLPVVLCCVIDVSGSMDSEAKVKDATGKEESHGLTILDLVKHAVKTIIKCLQDTDYLSIVKYSDSAQVVTKLTKMNKAGKDSTIKKLEALATEGMTNLWDGLRTGLDVIRECTEIQAPKMNSGCLLFTDGVPNVIPPKGHQAMLQNYIDKYQELPCVINTYGFGYSLDSPLLVDLAAKGNGNFSFIPDSGFVGTIFVNSISNLACHVAKNCVLKISADPEKYDIEVYGHDASVTSWGAQIQLGSIMYGQNKDVVVRLAPKASAGNTVVDSTEQEQQEGKEPGQNDANDVVSASGGGADEPQYDLEYLSLRSKQVIRVSGDDALSTDDDANGTATQMSYFRLRACEVLRECMKDMKLNEMKAAQQKLKDFIKEISAAKQVAKEKYVQDLLKDLEGQAFEAISKKDFFDKWGKHYYPSLIFAHLQQYNNNFKDPGVQNYGGKLFNELRDKANDVFVKLPPPKPSVAKRQGGGGYGGFTYGGGGGGGAAAAAPVNMRAYYNVGGGCFHGDCNVRMADDSYKAVKHLCRNDVVFGGYAVQCVVKHECVDKKSSLTNVNGLLLTPYHPIMLGGEWMFPADVEFGHTRTYSNVDHVYNFVLSHGHTLEVNGVCACTLGHNFKSNQVIEHAYFGTNQVVDDLKKCQGWNNGVVALNKDAFQRDADDQTVYAMQI